MNPVFLHRISISMKERGALLIRYREPPAYTVLRENVPALNYHSRQHAVKIAIHCMLEIRVMHAEREGCCDKAVVCTALVTGRPGVYAFLLLS